ncbi:hypothetical protein P3T76_002726 [Phytophthora citrophthora]|uniref:Uncharacterized protein n=1 Tax=Phytophthora citrophthora TaxID=4793 RepID=A0AAD9GX57_9STRA|nr:hypothetical protein P3T76_002726 [Phytophthora citrophthora]
MDSFASEYRNVSSCSGGMSVLAKMPKRGVFVHSSSYNAQLGLQWLIHFVAVLKDFVREFASALLFVTNFVDVGIQQ